jgi:hypothetical protein
VSFLHSIEESGDLGVSSVKRSTISESSGEERMRNMIHAATLRAFCRICKGEDNRLIYPCQCHTIRPQESWAHRRCIKEHILNTQSDTCNRCKVHFALNYDHEKWWLCKEFSRSQAFVTQLVVLLTGGVLLCCLIALLSSDAMDYSYEEQGWAYFLVAFYAVLLLLFSFGLVVQQSLNRLHTKDVYVLCQKQEIAQMTSKSRQIFLAFLAMHEHKLPKVTPQTAQPLKHKVSQKLKSLAFRGVKAPIYEEPENTERSNESLNPGERDLSPILAASQTQEENACSEDLREHSLVRESLVVLWIEDLKNHSFSVVSRFTPEEGGRQLHSFSN